MRDLNDVIHAMLNEIPIKRETEGLRNALEHHLSEAIYTAPECAEWHIVGAILQNNMGKFTAGDVWTDDWCEKMLKIWRDEK